MVYKDFQDVSLSMLGMGNMRLPVEGGVDGAPIDREKAREIIDYAMKSGVNYYDTAYVYHGGESESFLGEALGRYPRESYFLATKFFILANPDYKAVFEQQLERLRTDHIDFYLIHGIFDHTWKQYIESGCIEYFKQLKKEGKIRYLGFSTHAALENLTEFADYTKWDFAQVQLNCFDWRFGAAKKEYEALRRRGIPVMVMEPVRGGRLTSLNDEAEALLKAVHKDWSVAQWALRWVKRLEGVQVVLSGMSNMDQITQNVATFATGEALSDEECEVLNKALDLFRNNVRVPCTACRYCCDDCPVQINIPKVLEVYNKVRLDGPWMIEMLNEVETKGKPSDCISCGACRGHCPQGIDIPAIMQELAQRSEKEKAR